MSDTYQQKLLRDFLSTPLDESLVPVYSYAPAPYTDFLNHPPHRIPVEQVEVRLISWEDLFDVQCQGNSFRDIAERIRESRS